MQMLLQVVLLCESFVFTYTRSVNALTDICERSPNIQLCSWYNTGSTVDSQILTTFLPESTTSRPFIETSSNTFPVEIVTDSGQSFVSDYCDKYKSHYSVFCSKPSTDTDINLFCSTYNTQCHPPDIFTTKAVDIFQTVEPLTVGTVVPTGSYCDKYKAHFAYHCANGLTGNPDVDVFCNAYNKVCNPSIPASGTGTAAGAGTAITSTDSPMVNPSIYKDYCDKYRRHFGYYCGSKSNNEDINLFCNTYSTKC